MVDTVRSVGEIITILADNIDGDITAQDLRDMLVSLDDTGWAQYEDTQYTEGSPFVVAGNIDTVLPNNAGAVLDFEKPRDVDTFYDGSAITGRNGDGILITLDLITTPTSAATTTLEVWLDIGAPVGELYRRIISFPKGNGISRPVNFTVSGYTLGTWAANGATVYLRGNGPLTVHKARYIITRTHRARR